MPQWIHDRAKRLQKDNPSMPESEAFAIATQQSHATGHSPKGYGTAEGRRTAKRKYDGPRSSYQKTASIEELSAVRVAALLDELEQIKEAGLLRKLVFPAVVAAGLGGGSKVVQHMAAKAPTAIVAKAPVVAKGMGGFSQAANQVREFMP